MSRPFTRTGCVCGDPNCQVPYGKCHCGCGLDCPPARQSDRSRNWVRGLPIQYVIGGHNARGQKHTTKQRDAPRFEVYEGTPCVWIQRANGTWTLVDENCYHLVNDRPWYSNKGYSHWESPDGSVVTMQDVILPTPEGMVADHVNRKRWDNRRINLRPATLSQNQWNRKVAKNNTTGYPGVRKHRDKYQSRINVFGEEKCLGSFDTYEEAVAVRKKAELEYHGEFRWEAA